MKPVNLCLLGCAVLIFLTGGIALAGFNLNEPIIPNLVKSTFSTVPSNGDSNPYGVAFVPKGFPEGGLIQPGDILVSNFNNSAGLQVTGTTIVVITPATSTPATVPQTFFTSTAAGLTLALGILKQGFVLVGNVPSTNGSGVCTSTTVGAGSLQFLDKNANVVLTLTSAQFLDGPWGLVINEVGNSAQVFVANVLSGTVTRLDLTIDASNVTKPIEVISETQIASGYTFGSAGAAFVAGPSGLAYDSTRDVLYVSSTQDQAI